MQQAAHPRQWLLAPVSAGPQVAAYRLVLLDLLLE